MTGPEIISSALMALGMVRALQMLLDAAMWAMRRWILRADHDAFAAERGGSVINIMTPGALRRAARADRDAFIARVEGAAGGDLDIAQRAAIIRMTAALPEVEGVSILPNPAGRALRDLARDNLRGGGVEP